MEKNYSYVSPDLDWVEVDSSMCCVVVSGDGESSSGNDGDGDDGEW